jgi:spore coat polysaccharide biosynthesis protein SpsF (cytidylyltransferase family)
MRTLAFVQARMGSSRLPGKSLLPVWGEVTLLELVLRRTAAARALDGVVLATTDSPRDQPLVAVADRLGLPVFRGDEYDVLGRFDAALRAHPADAVVRICADNPFVDPSAIDALVAHFQAIQPCEYASNLDPESGLPDGAGAEIAASGALARAAAEATDPYEREHPTAYLRARPASASPAAVPAPSPPWPRVRLDVDTPDDYLAMRALAGRLPEAGAPTWPLEQIMAAYSSADPAGDQQAASSPL